MTLLKYLPLYEDYLRDTTVLYDKEKEVMMFASREDPDKPGTWRLCIRRGRIIREQDWYDDNNNKYKIDIAFNSYAKSKACADELNSSVLEEYEEYMDRDNRLINAHRPLPVEVMVRMMDIIEGHLADA